MLLQTALGAGVLFLVAFARTAMNALDKLVACCFCDVEVIHDSGCVGTSYLLLLMLL